MHENAAAGSLAPHPTAGRAATGVTGERVERDSGATASAPVAEAVGQLETCLVRGPEPYTLIPLVPVTHVSADELMGAHELKRCPLGGRRRASGARNRLGRRVVFSVGRRLVLKVCGILSSRGPSLATLAESGLKYWCA